MKPVGAQLQSTQAVLQDREPLEPDQRAHDARLRKFSISPHRQSWAMNVVAAHVTTAVCTKSSPRRAKFKKGKISRTMIPIIPRSYLQDPDDCPGQRSQVSISASAALVPATRPRRPPERRPLEVTPKKCYEDFKAIMSKKPPTTSTDCDLPQPLEPSQQLSHIPIVAIATAMAAAKSQIGLTLQIFRGNHGDVFFEQFHCN
ncbi:hypothetical protein BKA56DRAFT_615418 [Ilyonectria sp. MPI-CAGE-AT-0026]|nr:hypothetical protein BKA56DRAFT_615418 [Ilyonectria sp. MPI-CAGE-AT-0026]